MTDSERPGTGDEPAVTGEVTAGEVGVHRQSMNVPLFDPGDSLNRAPQRLKDDLLRDLAAAPPHGSGGPTAGPPEPAPSPAGNGSERPQETAAAGEQADPAREPPGLVAVAAKTVLLLMLRRLMRGGGAPAGARPARRPSRHPARRQGRRRGRRRGRVGSADDGSRTLRVPILRRGRG